MGAIAIDLGGQVRAISLDGVDLILHLAGDGQALAALLNDKGRLISTLGLGADQHPAATAIMATPTAATLDRLAVSRSRSATPTS